MLDVGLELNVLFDDPFWIGVFYLTNGDKCYVERVVFGQEPSDGEIYVYFSNNYHKLNFVAEFKAKHKDKPKNPKRLQRMIRKQSMNLQTGTKSMQALKRQYEQNKAKNKIIRREQRTAEKEHLFVLKQQKRKAKHRGH